MDEVDSLSELFEFLQLEEYQLFRRTNVNDPMKAIIEITSGAGEGDFCYIPVGSPPSALILEHIKTYLINGMCHDDIQFEVESIVELQNDSDWEVPNRNPSQDYSMFLWHGTTLEGAMGILKNGFEMPSSQKADSLMFGNGIYFADRVSKSAQYCDNKKGGRRKLSPEKGQKGYLFLCDVNVGNMLVVHEPLNGYESLPQGYDSIKGEGSIIPNPEEFEFYEGSIIPLGASEFNSTVNEGSNNSLRLNEYVVYDPSRIDVRFLIVIRFN